MCVCIFVCIPVSNLDAGMMQARQSPWFALRRGCVAWGVLGDIGSELARVIIRLILALSVAAAFSSGFAPVSIHALDATACGGDGGHRRPNEGSTLLHRIDEPSPDRAPHEAHGIRQVAWALRHCAAASLSNPALLRLPSQGSCIVHMIGWCIFVTSQSEPGPLGVA